MLNIHANLQMMLLIQDNVDGQVLLVMAKVSLQLHVLILFQLCFSTMDADLEIKL